MLHLKNPLFPQTERYGFRDPAACIENGVIHLFFTLVENVGGEQFLYVAESKSRDFMHWTKPLILTERDPGKNYSSPGNVIKKDGTFVLCLQSYPRPNGEKYGNDDSRIQNTPLWLCPFPASAM